MNLVDIGIIILILLSILVGIKRGVIKGLVKLGGLLIISILAYTFKDTLASWLMSFMPFFDFSGIFHGVKAVNILFYQAVSFLVIFIVLYCILNILVVIAGIFDKILQKTIILAIPDRLLGGLVGFIEGVMLSFIALFIMSLLPNTQELVFSSRFGTPVLERTPIIRKVLTRTTQASREIYQLSEKYKDNENKEEFTRAALQVLIKKQIISASEVEKIEKTGKLGIENITFR